MTSHVLKDITDTSLYVPNGIIPWAILPLIRNYNFALVIQTRITHHVNLIPCDLITVK